MGRKKKKKTSARPFCYYCDRDFDDELVRVSCAVVPVRWR